MRTDAEHSSVVEVESTHAPTTIPEEPTPVSPASPAIPVDVGPEASEAARQAQSSALPEQPKQPAGRFIENISSDGSRASAEDEAATESNAAAATAPGGVPEAEMKQARSSKPTSNVFRRVSAKKGAQTSKADARASSSQSQRPASGNEHHVSPSTESSTQKASPHPNDLSSSSDEGARHFRAFKKIKGETSDDHAATHDSVDPENKDDEDDDDEEEHPILDALYPLSHFIGYRPLSHPHTPAERRRTSKHPKFNRFHYICGRIFSFGLPVSGNSGEIARYRHPYTGEIELVRMYKDQVGAKIINSIHSVIAAWVVIALLALVSRSRFHRAHDAPLVIGAFATEAVVTFFAFRTPLAQPKNILMGNTISAVIGVAMEKAFADTRYSVDAIYGIDWAVAATSVAVAVFAMQIFGFTHPPGAAIALLAITDPKTHQLYWWLIPIVIINSLIVIGWALLINNVGGRRYPENWFYSNAFSEPPVIGPEKLPFSNSPFHPPPSRHGQKRKRGKKDEKEEEKGFYRVPDSGVKISQGFGSSAAKAQPEPQPKPTVAAASSDASHNVGEAGRVRHEEQSNLPAVAGARQSLGVAASGAGRAGGEDGRITRASEVTKVESTDEATVAQPQPNQGSAAATQQQSAAPASAVPPAVAPVATTAPTEEATASVAPNASPSTAPAAPANTTDVKSRMIETDATMVARNNSKGSKRSRRSIVVHVNENRRHSDASGKAPPVPAVQWRNT
ncbi:hypothetical protein EX895_001355 [Sporisorium graminicola]|uniref:HPP transmembrane region domain-containing protein n=1 Tax=Sporisorium graminicola TaxID=280036 RepID=A0A4U7KYC8_9BASI|nr:hypothetical protein EX895_001355 [Sporisorium graminicola]TKY89570.1 hypothetical protein EX895_001355 [Sporisorium graminicola]